MSARSGFPWPNGAQAAVAVTVNFHGESVERRTLPDQPLWGRYSYGRYGAQAGVERLLEVFRRYGVRATFFIGGWDAERYAEAMQRIAAAGHEIAGHGYAHEDFSQLAPEEQRAALERGEQALEQVFGRKPAGWRAPDGLMGGQTRVLLAERGYRYDSSYCDDDVPYVVNELGGLRIVELPQQGQASDRPYYAARRPPEVVATALREELDATFEVGGLFNLALHPRGDYGSGRSVRIRAVEAVLQAIREHPRLWTATCAEVADCTLEAAR